MARAPQLVTEALEMRDRIPEQSPWRAFADGVLAGDELAPTPKISSTDTSAAMLWMAVRLRTEDASKAAAFEPRWRTRILVADVLERLRRRVIEPVDLDELSRTFEESLGDQPDSIQVLYARAGLAIERGEYEAAERSIREAIAAQPDSVALRQRLWRIQGEREDAQARRDELVEDLADMQKRRPSAIVAWSARFRLDQVGLTEQADRNRELILEKWPESAEAEWVRTETTRPLFSEAMGLAPGTEERKVVEAKLARAVDEALSHQSHNPSLRGEFYRDELMVEVSSGRADVQHLDALVHGFVHDVPVHWPGRYLSMASAAIRGGASPDAIQAVIDAGRTRVRELRHEDEASLLAHLDLVESQLAMSRGDVATAAKLVERAAPALDVSSTELLIAQARVALARGDDEPIALELCAAHPACRPFMEESFEPHGKVRTFEQWVEDVRRRARPKRKALVLAERKEQPLVLEATSLQQIAGDEVVAIPEEQRVVIVEFVSGTCGPCLAQVPQLREVEKQLPRHARLVLAAADDPEHTFAKLREAGYEGPVFDATELWSRLGLRAYPMTYFVDADGRVQYEHMGASPYLVDEFLWRVADMK